MSHFDEMLFWLLVVLFFVGAKSCQYMNGTQTHKIIVPKYCTAQVCIGFHDDLLALCKDPSNEILVVNSTSISSTNLYADYLAFDFYNRELALLNENNLQFYTINPGIYEFHRALTYEKSRKFNYSIDDLAFVKSEIFFISDNGLFKLDDTAIFIINTTNFHALCFSENMNPLFFMLILMGLLFICYKCRVKKWSVL